MTRVLLIRHGESRATVERMIGGYRTCAGLTLAGRTQAERLRDRWLERRDFTPDVLIASQFPRALETAEILRPALGDLRVVEDEGFGEHDPGPDCDGISFDEFTERYGRGEAAWQNGNPFDVTFPGGETIAAFHYRVGTALQRVLDEHEGRTSVIVCHGGVVSIVLRIALKAPPLGLFQTFTHNTSITELELLPPNTWRIHRYNDAAHLA